MGGPWDTELPQGATWGCPPVGTWNVELIPGGSWDMELPLEGPQDWELPSEGTWNMGTPQGNSGAALGGAQEHQPVPSWRSWNMELPSEGSRPSPAGFGAPAGWLHCPSFVNSSRGSLQIPGLQMGRGTDVDLDFGDRSAPEHPWQLLRDVLSVGICSRGAGATPPQFTVCTVGPPELPLQ